MLSMRCFLSGSCAGADDVDVELEPCPGVDEGEKEPGLRSFGWPCVQADLDALTSDAGGQRTRPARGKGDTVDRGTDRDSPTSRWLPTIKAMSVIAIVDMPT
ncbi:MAG: hypothetical protein AMXMBFR46_15030 [Acidimicrobiia bacterium]